MALTSCRECGGRVSDKAAACPHCGCPINLKTASPPRAVDAPQRGQPPADVLATISRQAAVPVSSGPAPPGGSASNSDLYCPDCDFRVTASAEICPGCGSRLIPSNSAQAVVGWAVLGYIFLRIFGMPDWLMNSESLFWCVWGAWTVLGIMVGYFMSKSRAVRK